MIHIFGLDIAVFNKLRGLLEAVCPCDMPDLALKINKLRRCKEGK